MHQHRAIGFGSLNSPQGLEYIGVVNVIGAIGKLHLMNVGVRQPVVRFWQKVDHRGDLETFQQRHRAVIRQGAAIEQWRQLEQVVLHFDRLRPLSRTNRRCRRRLGRYPGQQC
ncbi:hypothetical protein D3C78_1610370 [compost metagenome]